MQILSIFLLSYKMVQHATYINTMGTIYGYKIQKTQGEKPIENQENRQTTKLFKYNVSIT